MQFALQCQEADPSLAFKDSASYSPFKYVKYKSNHWKAVLQADSSTGALPECWTSTDASNAASGWWSDMLTFGPDLAVSSTADGTKSLGMVLTSGECAAASD